MIILGIDPGTRTVGWAMYDTDRRLLVGSGDDRFAGDDVDERVWAIYELWLGRIKDKKWVVDVVAYEQQISKRNNADGALACVAYFIRRVATESKLLWVKVAISSAKKLITGDGRADKAEVRAALEYRFRHKFKSEDAADAAAIAITAETRLEVEAAPPVDPRRRDRADIGPHEQLELLGGDVR